jgi:hypothetical protein
MADAWEHVQARPSAYRERHATLRRKVHPRKDRVMLPPRTISGRLRQLTSASTMISSRFVFPPLLTLTQHCRGRVFCFILNSLVYPVRTATFGEFVYVGWNCESGNV